MMLLPLTTPLQRGFVHVEIVERHFDDEDPTVAARVEVIRYHLEQGPGLAVPDAAWLGDLVLEILNGIDDAISNKRSEREGYGTAQQARALHRAGSALLVKIRRVAA